MEQTYDESPRTRTRTRTNETQERTTIFSPLQSLMNALAPRETRTQQTQQRRVSAVSSIVRPRAYRGFIVIDESDALPSGPRSNRSDFLNIVRKGDILIVTDMSPFGLIGHAAIMVSDTWVLEMTGAGEDEGSSAFGSRSFSSGCSSSSGFFSSGSSSSRFSSSQSSSKRKGQGNNIRSSKEDWYEGCRSGSETCVINVFRCPDRSIANKAADWAYKNYYDSSFGDEQTIHVDYSLITIPFSQTDPSYCSKLVLQAFYYGTGDAVVLGAMARVWTLLVNVIIVPTVIPKYFKSEYTLQRCGWY